MNICIRTDGGCEIGMGHIMRTLALAKKLKYEKHNVFFACKVNKPLTNKYKVGIDYIKNNDFKVEYIPEYNLKENIKNIKADCLITDSYDVDEEYFNIVKKNFKISGCLDDEKICNYYNVDFLINQNPYSKQLNYKVNDNTKLMLGTKFVILRDEFRSITTRKKVKKCVKDIMITVGGSDNYNLTETIINKVNKLNYRFHIVIGNGFKYSEDLKKYESKKIILHFKANMRNLMNKCDLCISSCGTTIYELAMCGIPTIGIVVAENQKMAAETMKKLGAIEFCTIENLCETVEKLDYNERLKLSKVSKELIDGKGIDRIIKTIEECFKL